MKTLLIFLITTSFSFTNHYLISRSSVSGNLVEAINRNPVQFATVTLVNTDSNKTAGVFKSLFNGYFEFEHLPKGNYQLIVSARGFDSLVLPVVSLFGTDQEVYLGKVLLHSNADGAFSSKEESLLKKRYPDKWFAGLFY